MDMKLTIFYPRSEPTFLVYGSPDAAQAHVRRILGEYQGMGHYVHMDVDTESELLTYTVKNAFGRTAIIVTLQPVRDECRGVDLPTSEPQPGSPSDYDRYGNGGG